MEFRDMLMNTILELVAAPGISGTESENLASDKIYEILGTIPYFRQNPENLQKIGVKNDTIGRTFISALFRSRKKTNRTIILTGHHDVVSADGYGHLRSLAFSPVELTKRIGELGLSKEDTEDLDSGEWLFGRGVADMKHGLALGIELLRELSGKDDFTGNILFLSVPSEEYNSEGMLGAIDHLAELQASGLEYSGLLLLEPSSFGSAEEDKSIHIGAVGKVNPLFFFVGKETHASEPFEGLNANMLSSEFNKLFELDLGMCEVYKGELSVPPTCLKQTDLRDLYCVTTPLYAAAYYNLETFSITTDELISKLRNYCRLAFENVLEIYCRKRTAYENEQNKGLKPMKLEPVIYTYSELYEEVRSIFGDEFDTCLDLKIREWERDGLDKQTIAIHIVRETCDWYPKKMPMIVIGFAPPYYPGRCPDLERDDIRSYYNEVDSMIAYAKEKYGINIVKNDFYGVSDFSYIELGDKKGIDELSSNMLGLGKSYIFPVESLKKLSIPGIVFGCWGKDVHKNTERINIPYSFDILPDLCRKLIYGMFK